MGFGDEIMATAEARRAQRTDPRAVAILDRKGRPRWHPIWEHNPRIATPEQFDAGCDVQTIANGGGCRPYLDQARSTREQFFFNKDYRAEPGEIYLTEAERAHGRRTAGAIVIEPWIKQAASRNKDWGLFNWKELIVLLGDLPLVQLVGPGMPPLRPLRQVPTRNEREAAAAIAGARACVLPEGGLHHAAAALGVPAVVIFGGYTHPATTGYDLHVNLFTGGEACGQRLPCKHCREAMNAISPAAVAAALRALLAKRA